MFLTSNVVLIYLSIPFDVLAILLLSFLFFFSFCFLLFL